MNIWLKRLPVILCSGFFFPLSCTLGTAVSLPVIKHFDTRDMTKGDLPHPDSFVLANSQNSIQVIRLDDLQHYREVHPQTGFLLKQSSGMLEPNEYTTISYEVIEQTENTQIIEAKLRDDDGHISVSYEVKEGDIRALNSQGYFKSYAFLALRNGIILAFFLYLAGRVLRKIYI